MSDEKKQAPTSDALGSSAIILTGVIFLAATVAPPSTGFHIDADPWMGVAIIAIGAALRAVALWRSSYEDE